METRAEAARKPNAPYFGNEQSSMAYLAQLVYSSGEVGTPTACLRLLIVRMLELVGRTFLSGQNGQECPFHKALTT
jgi:hypothetical protein